MITEKMQKPQVPPPNPFGGHFAQPNYGYGTVSYTHLDVYKRQFKSSAVIGMQFLGVTLFAWMVLKL